MEAVLHAPAHEPKHLLVPRRGFAAPGRAWNPTVARFLAAIAAFRGIAVASQVGSLSHRFAIPNLGLCYYAIFTPLHDSTHRVAHRNRTVAAAIGRAAGSRLMLADLLFRPAHLTPTNVPGHDPDLRVSELRERGAPIGWQRLAARP